jgi:hypothetical protein
MGSAWRAPEEGDNATTGSGATTEQPMYTPIFDELLADLTSKGTADPADTAPCTCDHTPDECAAHPEARFEPASEWPDQHGDVTEGAGR